MTILVTGGAGFIGSNFILEWLAGSGEAVVNLDKLTYAGNPRNLASLADDQRYRLVHAGIEDSAATAAELERHAIRAVVNFAAETHVDRSIAGPRAFVATNVVGTLALLEAVKAYWEKLPQSARAAFRFLHISTDEVYGSLGPDDPPFCETTPYRPNSPYAASKAASDHLVRSFGETYGLPVLISNCSNNFGPYQFPEKLVPLIICRALADESLPVYGDGRQVRDWLHVADHCAALRRVLADGRPGEAYAIGGGSERANIDVVHEICAILDRLRPRPDGRSYADQISFVKDRPGHDRRYAIDSTKLQGELGWRPRQSFEAALEKTVRWNLDNADWVAEVTSGEYRRWIDRQYA
jgi:dTDP-glucose 4,6-dehydratase